MLVLGLQGSPRKKGNTNYLLKTFLEEAASLGANTTFIEAAHKNILPCKEYIVCEKKGFCPIDDDMKHEIYPLLRQADVIVAASPVFFYNVTAQLKALIDRSQTLWARKYKLKLIDPARHYRRGFLLGVAATRGKNLFEGMHLTAQYFFDAVGARYEGGLTYRGIEGPKDIQNHPSVQDDVKAAVKKLLQPLIDRKKILFACRENACRSQMASAFAQHYAGDKLDVSTGGSQPADNINPTMVETMQERGLDMAFRIPQSIDTAIKSNSPDIMVTMGCGEQCPLVPGARMIDWDLPDPSGESTEFMRNVRDEIDKRVTGLIAEIT
jgi:multimeric flavodoxin WrbA